MADNVVLVRNLPHALLHGKDGLDGYTYNQAMFKGAAGDMPRPVTWNDYFRAVLGDEAADRTDLEALQYRYDEAITLRLRGWYDRSLTIDGTALEGAAAVRSKISEINWLIDVRGRFEDEQPLADFARASQQPADQRWRITDRADDFLESAVRFYANPDDYIARMSFRYGTTEGFPEGAARTLAAVAEWHRTTRGPLKFERITAGRWAEQPFGTELAAPAAENTAATPVAAPPMKGTAMAEDNTPDSTARNFRVLAEKDDGTKLVFIQGRLKSVTPKKDKNDKSYSDIQVVVDGPAGEDGKPTPHYYHVTAYGDRGPQKVGNFKAGTNLTILGEYREVEKLDKNGTIEKRELISAIAPIGINVYLEGDRIAPKALAPAPQGQPAPVAEPSPSIA